MKKFTCFVDIDLPHDRVVELFAGKDHLADRFKAFAGREGAKTPSTP